MTRPLKIIQWWERRRLIYNLCLIGACVLLYGVCFGTTALMSYLRGNETPQLDGFIFGVLLYLFGANLCYTTGWITELILKKTTSIDTQPIAKVAFVAGTVFSMILTIVPAGIFIIIALFATFTKTF